MTFKNLPHTLEDTDPVFITVLFCSEFDTRDIHDAFHCFLDVCSTGLLNMSTRYYYPTESCDLAIQERAL